MNVTRRVQASTQLSNLLLKNRNRYSCCGLDSGKHLAFRQWLKPGLDKSAENISDRVQVRRPRQRSHQHFQLAYGARGLRMRRL